jgi:hypothetical protein
MVYWCYHGPGLKALRYVETGRGMDEGGDELAMNRRARAEAARYNSFSLVVSKN